MIRRWQLEACDGDHCAAALLSFFEYWHNFKVGQAGKAAEANAIAEQHGEKRTQDESLVQWHTNAELQRGLLGLYSHGKITSAIKKLKEKGFVRVFRNPNRRYAFDATKHFVFEEQAVNDWIASRFPEIGRSACQNQHTACRKDKTACQTRRISDTEITSETTSEISKEAAPAAAGDGQEGGAVARNGTKAKPGASGSMEAAPPRLSEPATGEPGAGAGPFKEFIAGWWAAYQQQNGMPYVPNRAADFPAAKRITGNGRSVEELLDLARFAWQPTNVDRFIWGQAQTIAGFASRLSVIQAAYVAKVGRKLTEEEKAANVADGQEWKNADW